MAGETEKKAVKAIETVMVLKAKEVLNPYKKTVITKITTRLKNKFGNDGKPSPTVKSVGAFLKVVKELSNPEYTHKTQGSETKIKVLQFKSLTIDYKANDSDLKFNFKTNGKDASFGLGMSF